MSTLTHQAKWFAPENTLTMIARYEEVILPTKRCSLASLKKDNRVMMSRRSPVEIREKWLWFRAGPQTFRASTASSRKHFWILLEVIRTAEKLKKMRLSLLLETLLLRTRNWMPPGTINGKDNRLRILRLTKTKLTKEAAPALAWRDQNYQWTVSSGRCILTSRSVHCRRRLRPHAIS